MSEPTHKMQSSDDVARDLTYGMSKLAAGLNLYDVQRALCAVMSCGICTSSKDVEAMREMLDAVYIMLRNQVYVDWPKIQAMKDKGEAYDVNLTLTRM